MEKTRILIGSLTWFSFAMVSSSVQSTRLNHLVCRDIGGREEGKRGLRGKGREGESKRGSKREMRSEEIRRKGEWKRLS